MWLLLTHTHTHTPPTDQLTRGGRYDFKKKRPTQRQLCCVGAHPTCASCCCLIVLFQKKDAQIRPFFQPPLSVPIWVKHKSNTYGACVIATERFELPRCIENMWSPWQNKNKCNALNCWPLFWTSWSRKGDKHLLKCVGALFTRAIPFFVPSTGVQQSHLLFPSQKQTFAN